MRPIKHLWIAYSEKVFQEGEERYYQNRPDLRGRTLTLIEDALKEDGWEVKKLNVDKPLGELVNLLTQERIDLVFNLAVCASEIYDQALVPSILDSLKIPYLGSNSVVHSLCLDRAFSKLSLRGIGVPTPSSFLWSPKEEWPSNIDFPVIVKPRFRTYLHAPTLESIVNDQEALQAQAEQTYQETRERVLLEKYLEGREIVVGLWGNSKELSILPLLEVNVSKEKPIRDLEIKNRKGYVEDAVCPANLPPEHQAQIEKSAEKVFRELYMHDYATFHVLFSEKDQIPFFFELNSLPLLHFQHSAFPEMCVAAGIDYPTMVQKLVRIAQERIDFHD
ncbi:MAG: D-alanine-D-alanine ligase [Candidatus Atribacteria bacterium]|nr:D-alanine-D-alanine ligase [Candidatus Atribacteria bacterium]